MSGLQIRTSDKHLPYDRDVGDFVLAVTDGLMGQWFLGGDAEFAVKNRWSRGGYGDGELYGDVVFSNYYGSFKGGNKGMFLPFSDPVEGSYFIVVRNTDILGGSANQPGILGTSPGSLGSNIFYNSTSPTSNVYTTDGNFTSTRSVTDTTAWMLLALIIDSNSLQLHNLSAGNAGTDNAWTGTRAPALKQMAIGAHPGTSSQGTFDMAYCGIFNQAKTADERALIYAQLKAMMADRGIAI